MKIRPGCNELIKEVHEFFYLKLNNIRFILLRYSFELYAYFKCQMKVVFLIKDFKSVSGVPLALNRGKYFTDTHVLVV